MKRIYVILFILLMTFVSGCTDSMLEQPADVEPAAADVGPEGADIVFTNAAVYTVNDAELWAEAVAVQGNEIVYVGDLAGVETFIGENTDVRDLNGAMLLPGFIDSHMHPGVAAYMTSLGVNLIGVGDKAEVVRRVTEYAEANPDVEVIAGFGYFLPPMGPDSPHKDDLDAVFPDRKVFLVSGGGHSAWANSATLEFLGINKDTPDPQAGAHFYVRDAEGNPTGHLVEGGAFWSHVETLGLGTKEDFLAAFPRLLPAFPPLGITGAFDAGTPGVQEFALQALVEMDEAGELPVRYHATNYIISREQAQVAVEELQRLRDTYSSRLVNPTAIKISNDGAAPDGPYHIQFREEELGEIFTAIAEAGEDVMIHVTVEESINEAVNAAEVARNAAGNFESRINLTHAEIFRPEDIQRVGDMQLIVSVQPPFGQFAEFGAFFIEQMGANAEEFLKNMGRYRSLKDAGATVTLGADFPACGGPISSCSPLHMMESAITRQSYGQPDSDIVGSGEERLSVGEAIKSQTLDSAFQVRMEDKIGSIEVGKLADLVVLADNLFEISPNEIHQTAVLLTMVDGRVVYDELGQ